MTNIIAFVKKEKFWLLLTTCVLIAVAAYALYLPKLYRAEVIINVDVAKRERVTYSSFFKSAPIIKEAVGKLDLDKPPFYLTPERLSKKVLLSSSWRHPNELSLTVMLRDADMAVKVANFVAERSIKSYEELLEVESKKVSTKVGKIDIGDRADDYLQAYEKAINDFASALSEGDVDTYNSKIGILTDQLTELKHKQQDIDLEIALGTWRMEKLGALKDSGTSSIQNSYAGWLGIDYGVVSVPTEPNYLSIESLMEEQKLRSEECCYLLDEISKKSQRIKGKMDLLQKELAESSAKIQLLRSNLNIRERIYINFVSQFFTHSLRTVLARESELYRRKPIFTIVSPAQFATEAYSKCDFLLRGFALVIAVIVVLRFLIFPVLISKKQKESSATHVSG